MNQEWKEKFWKAAGAKLGGFPEQCYWLDGIVTAWPVGDPSDPDEPWLNPHDADLETLLDVFERVAPEHQIELVSYTDDDGVRRYYCNPTDTARTDLLTRKAAVIAAICALTGVEMPEGGA